MLEALDVGSDGLGNGVVAGGDEPTHEALYLPDQKVALDEREQPLGERAGLVKGDDIDGPGRLERLRRTKQDSLSQTYAHGCGDDQRNLERQSAVSVS